MWVEAGFDPDNFWHQTPDTFGLTMKGVRKRMERESDAQITLAWQTGAFAASAQAGKLKPLRSYIRKPGPVQKPSEMLAHLREFQARGAGMKITKIAR
jgi:hypothetical protein